MSDSPYIVDVDLASFETIVIENSFHAPVLVDFWSNSCNACEMLMPVLSNIIEEFPGQILLANVNGDEQQELAVQYGVRSLPTVKLFRNGEIVDEFIGAQAESSVRQMLEPYLSRPSDAIAMQAVTAYDSGDIEQALGLLASVYETDPANSKALILYGKLLAEQGQSSLALDILQQLPEEQLANLQIANGHYEAGMDLLMEIIRIDANFKQGIARQTLFKVFDMLGGSGPMVSHYRSKLYTLLH